MPLSEICFLPAEMWLHWLLTIELNIIRLNIIKCCSLGFAPQFVVFGVTKGFLTMENLDQVISVEFISVKG